MKPGRPAMFVSAPTPTGGPDRRSTSCPGQRKPGLEPAIAGHDPCHRWACPLLLDTCTPSMAKLNSDYVATRSGRRKVTIWCLDSALFPIRWGGVSVRPSMDPVLLEEVGKQVREPWVLDEECHS